MKERTQLDGNIDCSIKSARKFFLAKDRARIEWNGGMIIFFQGLRVARVGRPQGRESFHVLVSTEPCCVNTPAANDKQQS